LVSMKTMSDRRGADGNAAGQVAASTPITPPRAHAANAPLQCPPSAWKHPDTFSTVAPASGSLEGRRLRGQCPQSPWVASSCPRRRNSAWWEQGLTTAASTRSETMRVGAQSPKEEAQDVATNGAENVANGFGNSGRPNTHVLCMLVLVLGQCC
jgi:hypothetical protein